MNAVNDLEEEKPLDPAVERVRRRMLRLMVISIGIMMTGLMAVLGAIVYKIGSYGEEAEAVAPAPMGTIASEGSINLDGGAAIISSSLDGDNILLRIRESDGAGALWIYSLTEGRVVARIAIE